MSIATDRTRAAVSRLTDSYFSKPSEPIGSIKNSIDHDTVSFELCVARDAYTAAREARLFLIQRLRSDFVVYFGVSKRSTDMILPTQSAVAEKNRVLKQNRLNLRQSDPNASIY